MMMREQARAGLQTQLDAAVTNGDTAAATKIAEDIAKLAVQSAPKAPPYGDVEIRAELEKAPWFGIDPKKSAKAVEFGKTMNPKKFATAEAFAVALIKAVDEEFKPAAAEVEEEAETEGEKKPVKKRATDAPGEGDALGNRTATNRRTGPWTKLTDAPADVQKEIKRTADKFVSSTAPKEQREKFIAHALESHYATHLRKGKK